MASAAVAEVFSNAQTSAAQHRRCSLKLRRLQGSEMSGDFQVAIQSALYHIAPANSASSSTKRLITFIAAACADIEGKPNDELGLFVLKVGYLIVPG